MNDNTESLIGRRIRITAHGSRYAPHGTTGTIVEPPAGMFAAVAETSEVDRDGDYWADMDHAPLGDSPVCVGKPNGFEVIAEAAA